MSVYGSLALLPPECPPSQAMVMEVGLENSDRGPDENLHPGPCCLLSGSLLGQGSAAWGSDLDQQVVLQ